MSWLNEQERDYVYDCPNCGEFVVSKVSKHPDYTAPELCGCGASSAYVKFLPLKVNIRGKVAFEQNGRKGYQITDGRGNVRYISATKDIYQETGDIRPQYTKAYREHLIKEGKSELLEEKKYDDIVKERKKTLEQRVKRTEAVKSSEVKSES